MIQRRREDIIMTNTASVRYEESRKSAHNYGKATKKTLKERFIAYLQEVAEFYGDISEKSGGRFPFSM